MRSYVPSGRVFQEMLYGICTGFGSPQVPVAELLARAAPTLHSPVGNHRNKSSNFLQVPDIESPRSAFHIMFFFFYIPPLKSVSEIGSIYFVN